MKRIQLTQGQHALVNNADFSRFGNLRWMAAWDPETKSFRATRHSPTINGKRKTIFMHREIMGITDPSVKVDHRNHDTLDNRQINLRPCTNAQNLANRKGKPKNNTSGHRGIDFNKASGKWRARICVNRKSISLGYFHDKKKAAKAYAVANSRLFGEFGGGL